MVEHWIGAYSRQNILGSKSDDKAGYLLYYAS
jgi:hypothetical protein